MSWQTRCSIFLTLSFSLRTKLSPSVLHFSVLTQPIGLPFPFSSSDQEVYSNTRKNHSRRGEGQHLATSTHLGELYDSFPSTCAIKGALLINSNLDIYQYAFLKKNLWNHRQYPSLNYIFLPHTSCQSFLEKSSSADLHLVILAAFPFSLEQGNMLLMTHSFLMMCEL